MVKTILTKLGKIGGTVTEKCPLSRDSWSHLLSFLVSVNPTLAPLDSSIRRKDTAQTVLRGDLSLEIKFLPTILTSITARTPSHFAALRRFLFAGIGLGVKKRGPSNTDREEGCRVFDLQQADVINIVCIDLDGLEEQYNNSRHNNDWFPDDAVQTNQYFNSQRNYLRFTYNQRLRELRVTIKAMAIKVGNYDALPFLNFLVDNGIPWGQDEEDKDEEAEVAGHNDGLRLRRGVMIENEM